MDVFDWRHHIASTCVYFRNSCFVTWHDPFQGEYKSGHAPNAVTQYFAVTRIDSGKRIDDEASHIFLSSAERLREMNKLMKGEHVSNVILHRVKRSAFKIPVCFVF